MTINFFNKRLLVLLLLVFCISVKAQKKKDDFFEGKWDVMVYGTSKGDQRMIIELKRINGKLQGAIVGPTDDVKKFTKIEETSNSVNLTFKYFIFNVNLWLQKKDDIHVIGKLQDEYKASGIKITLKN